MPKSSSAARETHTESSREPTIPMIPQLYQKLGDYVFEGDMSNTVTELMTGTNQPPPIEIDYSIHQTGSSSRLNKFRKMYPSTTYQIPRLTKTIGPARLISSDVQIQETGVCGFGRSGVLWPYSWYDLVNQFNQGVTLKTCQQSNFNRSQILQTMKTMFDEAWVNNPTPLSWSDFEEALENLQGGDQGYSFPMDSIESQFKYENRNVQLPVNISLYICTPKKDLAEIDTPQSNWFNPWATSKDKRPWPSSPLLQMRSDYFYNPAITSQENIAVTGTDPLVSTVTMKENVDNILTLSTEVVPDASPSGFSELFNENWEILTVRNVRLLPGQTLILNLKTHLSQPLNLDRFLGYGKVWNNETTLFRHQSFAGLTLAPMIKFYGDDVAGASKGLAKVTTPAGTSPLPDIKNRVFQSTAARSGPSMITAGHKVKARCSVQTAPLAGETSAFIGKRSIESILMNFSTRSRNLFRFDAAERGQQTAYWKINNFCEYFAGDDIVSDGTEYTQVVEFDPRVDGGVNHNSNPSWNQLTLLNPQVE